MKQEELHRGDGGRVQGRGGDDVKRISLQQVWAGQQQEEILQARV